MLSALGPARRADLSPAAAPGDRIWRDVSSQDTEVRGGAGPAVPRVWALRPLCWVTPGDHPISREGGTAGYRRSWGSTWKHQSSLGDPGHFWNSLDLASSSGGLRVTVPTSQGGLGTCGTRQGRTRHTARGSADTWGPCSRCWDTAKRGEGSSLSSRAALPSVYALLSWSGWRPGRGGPSGPQPGVPQELGSHVSSLSPS